MGAARDFEFVSSWLLWNSWGSVPKNEIKNDMVAFDIEPGLGWLGGPESSLGCLVFFKPYWILELV